MRLAKKEKVALTIALSFFGVLIIFALFIRCSHKNNKVDVPYKTNGANDLQNKIDQYVETTKETSDKVTTMDSTSDNVYTAVVISKSRSDSGDYYIPTFKAYYYDVETDSEISRYKVAVKFDTTEDIIYDQITAYFLDLYNQEVELGYVDKDQCDFMYCYMNYYRKCSSFDNYVLYVEDGKLYAYISFDPNSFEDDKGFFDSLNYDYYRIEIK